METSLAKRQHRPRARRKRSRQGARALLLDSMIEGAAILGAFYVVRQVLGVEESKAVLRAGLGNLHARLESAGVVPSAEQVREYLNNAQRRGSAERVESQGPAIEGEIIEGEYVGCE